MKMINIVCQTTDLKIIRNILEIEKQYEEESKEIEPRIEEQLKCNYCTNEINRKNPKSFNIILDYKNYKIACLNCNKKISKFKINK